MKAAAPSAPGRDCALCPRLAAYRAANRAKEPSWHNAPVPSWGQQAAPLLVLGLAPGVRGANRTGRPFTGDYAGKLLYGTLLTHGLARGAYGEDPKDGMELTGCRIANAVRCVPPENLPLPVEIRACNDFLKAMGIPTHMFTVLFAVARTVGWVSQWKELIEDPSQRIGRPRQVYSGAAERPFVPMALRS